MKKMQWLMLVATVAAPLFTGFAQTPAPQSSVALSPAAAEVVKLAQSGTSDEVLLAYIQNSSSAFNLSADQILYLKDVGISSQAISSMLNRDQALRNQPQRYDYQQRLYPPANPAPAGTPADEPVAAAPVESAPAAATVASTPAPPAATPAVATSAPAYVSSPPPDVTYFYQDLSPYGTWVDLPDYGWCWQPTVVAVNRSWRPYCDSGHWMWTDAGWYWVSDYSWGWAPFHYGRWYLHERCGWVWVPDRVWGPAWVAWRSSGDYCGWAPLPPRAVFDVHLGWSFNGVRVGVGFDFGLRADHFCFIGLGDFCSHDLGHRRLAPVEVTRVYSRTTIINNNYVVHNNTIINQGVKVERVAAATHTEIHKAVIRDLPAGANPAARHGAAKGTPVIYRPQLHAPAKPGKMVAQKLDARHPIIQHTEVAAPRTFGKPAPTANRSTTTTLHQPRQVEPGRTPARTVTEKQLPARTREEANPVTRSQPAPKPATEARTYPQRTPQKAWNKGNSAGNEGEAPHTYYPKGYYQSAEIHALPPLHPRENSSSSNAGGNGSSKRRHD